MSPPPIIPNQAFTEHSISGHQTSLDEMIYTEKQPIFNKRNQRRK
jgi:hypothetical protein